MKKMIRTLWMAALLCCVLTVGAAAAEENGYRVTITADDTELYASFAVPDDGMDQLYTLWFYNGEKGIQTSFVRYHDRSPGEKVRVSIVGTVDRVRIYPTLGGVDDPDQPYLMDLALDKPLIGAYEELEFPEGEVMAVAVENSQTQNKDKEYIYLFYGLDLETYDYTLTDPDTGKVLKLTEADLYLDGVAGVYGSERWIGSDMELRVMRAQEREDAYVWGYTKPRLLDIAVLEQEDAVALTVNGGGTVSMGNRRVKINGIMIGAETVNKSVTTEGQAKFFYTEDEWGYYDIVITRLGCLTHTIQDVKVAGKLVDLGSIDLVAGDVNGDDKINIADMGVFRQEFGKTGDAIGNVYTDVNNDGKVNIADMGIFRQNFGKTAEKDCTVTYG